MGIWFVQKSLLKLFVSSDHLHLRVPLASQLTAYIAQQRLSPAAAQAADELVAVRVGCLG